MKKFISVLLSLLMVFSLCLSVSADDTSDVPLEVPSEEPTGESNEDLSGESDVSLSDESTIKEGSVTAKNGSDIGGTNSSYNIKNEGTATYDNVNATAGNADSKMFENWDSYEFGIAKINDVVYKTLKEAITAANEGDTVTLINDAQENIVIDKNITLDLGGKTITNTNASGEATILINKDVSVTVKNGSVVGGTNSYYNIKNDGTATFDDVNATAGNADYSMFDNWGSLTINSGNYIGGLNVIKSENGSKLEINGGYFELKKGLSDITGVIFSYGTTTINNGEFVNTGIGFGTKVVVAGVVEGYESHVTINDGTFTNKNTKGKATILHGVGKATSDNFTVRGGEYNKEITKGYLETGFTCTKKDNMYVVKKKPVVATIGDIEYYSFQDAIANAKDGDTIKLLANVSLSKGVALDKNITLDLGEKTIKAKNKYVFDIYSNVVIKNGTVRSYGFKSNSGTIWLNKNASLLVEKDATIEATSNDGVSSFVIALYNDCDGASLNVNGTLKGENGVTVNGNILANNTVNIDGATIDVTGHGLYLAGVATTNISNTNVNAGSTAIEIRAGKLNIKDGTYTSAGEFKTSPNENGTTVDGAALAVSQHTKKLPIDVTIDGGSFKGGYSLYEANVQENDEESLAKVNIKINDGNFDGKFFIENNAEKSIKGGNYSVDVSKYLISGYNVAKINDTYKVVNDGEKISVTSPIPTVDETTYDEVKKVQSNSNGILLKTDLVNDLQSNEKDMLNKQTPSNSKLDQIVPLDINLYSVDENGVSTKITSLNSPITINMYLPDDIVDSIKNKTIKVARFHGGVLSMLDASLNGNILTFKTDKFSTYAIVAYGAVTPTSNVADKKAGPKDLNSDGIITCDEEMGSKNWIWSESKGACVYKVSNTSVK
ncbi:MAG: autotransporter adhesin family protein [Solobacterium sp.]|nr:autotransporter adhesin family protein [Solobacterium sp.]